MILFQKKPTEIIEWKLYLIKKLKYVQRFKFLTYIIT